MSRIASGTETERKNSNLECFSYTRKSMAFVFPHVRGPRIRLVSMQLLRGSWVTSYQERKYEAFHDLDFSCSKKCYVTDWQRFFRCLDWLQGQGRFSTQEVLNSLKGLSSLKQREIELEEGSARVSWYETQLLIGQPNGGSPKFQGVSPKFQGVSPKLFYISLQTKPS